MGAFGTSGTDGHTFAFVPSDHVKLEGSSTDGSSTHATGSLATHFTNVFYSIRTVSP